MIAIKGLFESFLLFSLPILKGIPFFLTWLKKHKSMLQCVCNIKIVTLTYFCPLLYSNMINVITTMFHITKKTYITHSILGYALPEGCTKRA